MRKFLDTNNIMWQINQLPQLKCVWNCTSFKWNATSGKKKQQFYSTISLVWTLNNYNNIGYITVNFSSLALHNNVLKLFKKDQQTKAFGIITNVPFI